MLLRDFHLIDFLGFLGLLGFLFVFLVVEIGAANQGIGGRFGLGLVELGIHQTGGEGVDLLFAQRGFGASLIGFNMIRGFLIGSHGGIVQDRGGVFTPGCGIFPGGRGALLLGSAFGVRQQPAGKPARRAAGNIGRRRRAGRLGVEATRAGFVHFRLALLELSGFGDRSRRRSGWPAAIFGERLTGKNEGFF